MVATVLKLRYRVLANTLARHPAQLVGFIFGMLSALWVLVLVVAGLVALAVWQGPEPAQTVAVLGGAVLILGWVLGPVLIAGTDATVDAARLAPFPLTRRQSMLALAGAGATGIPGIATAVVALAAGVLWVRWPVAAVAAVVCAVLAVATCVIASRLATTLSEGLGAGRRGREVVGTVLLGLIILAGPIVTGVLMLLDASGSPSAQLVRASAAVGWTPLGAVWAVPGDLALGMWLPALAKLVIAAATPAVLWLVWSRVLVAAEGASRQRAARTVRSGALGLFGVMPTGGVGATWARSLTAWLRDPRYLRQLIMVPLLPIVFLFAGGLAGGMFTASAVIVALVIALVGYTDVSYDGTAFATVLASGVRGRDDRLGRMLAAACVGIPLVLAVVLVTIAVSDGWRMLPAVLGAALALLLSGYAVSAVSSALIISPVPAPGDSPFKTVPGQTFVNGMLVFAVMGSIVVLSSPALVLAAIGAFAGLPVLAWLSVVVAAVVGVAAMIAGVVWGGRVLDRTGPDLLQRVRALPSR